MVIDSSSIVAIVQREFGFETLEEILGKAAQAKMSAVTYVELSDVLTSKRGDKAGQELDGYLEEALVQIVPVTLAQAKIAREAFLRYGKGRGNRAKLNLGDLFSYALAKSLDEPLLFVGNDFSQTDIARASLDDLQ